MKFIFLLLFFSAAFAGNAQSSGSWFRSGTVTLEYKQSPLFYIFNYSSTSKANSSGWLLVKVKYVPGPMKEFGKTMWLDGVSMETEAILPASYKSKNVTVLLKGKTVFWSIPMDGGNHEAWGCVPPQVIARFANKGYKIDLQKIIARVTFYTSGRKILMRAYSSSNSRAQQFFSQLEGAVTAGVLPVEDVIMPRNKTPWGVINYEQFDLIKPDTPK